MAENLKFDPYELHSHASEIDAAATDLKSRHQQAHDLISQSIPGLGQGAAAAAMSARLSEWESETSRAHADQTAHAQDIRDALSKLLGMDQRNKSGLDSTGR